MHGARGLGPKGERGAAGDALSRPVDAPLQVGVGHADVVVVGERGLIGGHGGSTGTGRGAAGSAKPSTRFFSWPRGADGRARADPNELAGHGRTRPVVTSVTLAADVTPAAGHLT